MNLEEKVPVPISLNKFKQKNLK